MATDFDAYLDHYKNFYSFEDKTYGDFEFLYNVFVYCTKLFFNFYTPFLLIHACVIYSIYLYSIRKYTIYPFIALLFLYVSMIGLLGSNRQNLALALCFMSINFIVKKKYLTFLIIVLIAFGFHKTAIIFLPVVFLNQSINFKLLALFLFFFALISFTPLVFKLFETVTQSILPSLFADKSVSYLLKNDEISNTLVGTIFGLIRKALPLFILVVFKRELCENKFYTIILNLTAISFVLYFIFNNNLQFLVGRLTIYFSIFECVTFSWLFVVIKKARFRIAYILLFFSYTVIIFFRSIAVYPELFIPYKSIFFSK